MFFHLCQNASFIDVYVFFVFFCIFASYPEIQDSRQKWQEKDFWDKSPVDSADTLQVKNVVEIALFCTVTEINVFFRFTQKLKIAAKLAGKRLLVKVTSNSADTMWVKNFIEITLSRTVFQDKCVSVFYSENQDGVKKFFFENCQWTLHNPACPNFVKIALSRTVSEIIAFLRLKQKFKMSAKNAEKTIFGEICQQTLLIPCGSKISLKSLYLTPLSR